MKVYILFSSQHARLAGNRLHGLSYDPTGPLRRSLKAERVDVHPSGVFPLFYEVVTGNTFATKTSIRMGDVYPYIADIAAEWFMATSEPARMVSLNLQIHTDSAGRRLYVALGVDPALKRFKVSDVMGLSSVTPVLGQGHEFVGPAHPASHSIDQVVAASIDRRYLYHPQEVMRLPLGRPPFAFAEEVPLALAIFHLGSVARYRAEYVSWISSSRYWPVVRAVRSHVMFKWLLLFWSYVRQANFNMSRL